MTNFTSIDNTGSCIVGNCNAQVSNNVFAPVVGSCNTGAMGSYYSGLDSLPSLTGLCLNGTLSGLSQISSGRSWNCL